MTKILIIEDDESTRRAYEDFLSEDYTPEDLIFKETADEGINELEHMLSSGEKPRGVITDNNTDSTKTGMDVIDYVIAKFTRVPVIMIAAENIDGTVEKTALEKGASAYLDKPVRMNTFLETVKEYVK